MTILWVGNEDVDFLGSVSDTSNSFIGSNIFARNGIKTANKCASATFTPKTSLWLSYYSIQTEFVENVSVSLRCSLSESCVGVGYLDGFSAFTNDDVEYFLLQTESENTMGEPGELKRIDVCVTNYGTNGNISAYVNGYQRINYTGNLVQGDGGSIDQVVINIIGNHQVFGFIVADEDTRNMYLKTLSPNATGLFSDWSGSYTDINELAISTDTTIHTDLVDKNYQCNLTGMPEGNFTIKALAVSYQALKGANGIRMRHGIYTNSETILEDPIDQSSFYTCTNQVYNLNPVTGIAFTPEEIETLQLAFQSII